MPEAAWQSVTENVPAKAMLTYNLPQRSLVGTRGLAGKKVPSAFFTVQNIDMIVTDASKKKNCGSTLTCNV
jgi:hypothetical protein